jgi:hypothetical protein
VGDVNLTTLSESARADHHLRVRDGVVTVED